MENKEITIFELIDDLKKGSEEAFEQIYIRYYKKIYFQAFNCFHDDQLAIDIVQDTFMKVYKSIHSLKANEAFNVWIKKICYSCCMDVIKKNNKYKEIAKTDDFDIEEFAPEKEISLPDIINRKEISQEISNSIQELTHTYQMVCILRFYEELSIKEISHIMHCSENVTNVRLNRAKKELREKLLNRGINASLSTASGFLPFLFKDVQIFNLTDHINNLFVNMIQKHDFGYKLGAFITSLHRALRQYLFGLISLGLVATGEMEIIKYMENEALHKNSMNAIINRVDYTKALVNRDLTLDVITNNDNFDQITINDSTDLVVKKNGKYKIKLLKNNVSIDEKEIIINNIDKEAPRIKEVEYFETFIKVTLHKDISKVDDSKIAITNDSNTKIPFTYDEKNNAISFPFNQEEKYSLIIYDFAGNYSKLNVQKGV